MEKKTILIYDDRCVIQDADYIEDGFYVEISNGEIILFEIPQFGGVPNKIGSFKSIQDAFKKAETLH